MRSLLLTLLIPLSIIWGLTAALRGILVFNWLTFMRPQDFVWSFWASQPLFRYGLFIMALSVLIHRRFKIRVNAFLIIYLCLYFWFIISCQFSFSKKISWDYFFSFLFITPFAFLFLSAGIESLKELRSVFWVMIVSISLIAFKASFMLVINGKFHLSVVTSGFVGDNNTLGLCLCLITAGLFGLQSSIKTNWQKVILFILIIFDILLILITQSRGAFVTVGIIALISIFSSKRPILYLVIFFVLITIGYSILPKEMFSRLNTLENVGTDESAMGRIDMWKRAVQISFNRPFTGVGPGGFQFYSAVMFPGELTLVTHSTYMQLLSTTGYPGLIFYLLLLFLTLKHLNYLCKFKKNINDPGLEWVGAMGFWLRSALIGYIFGSAFLDMLAYDIPWYIFLYSNLLYYLTKKHLVELETSNFSDTDNNLVTVK